ncbi:MAG: family N-acetyltransferase [Anaerocolumna sp.]|jgi:GNAT superfamily N-acetyltransferase|nr:family N-acetyltransferase [Anaerocolumna sp.]
MRVNYTDGKDADFIELCKELDLNLDELVGGAEQRKEYVQYNTLNKIQDVIVIYEEDVPVACAGFKYYDKITAELKRVFVKPEYRGRGISMHLITTIENLAKEKGYSTMVLETGKPLVAATSLYDKLGYKVIGNYGQYKDMLDSICMEKSLV